MVTLESTGDYWRIWFYVLEECGLRVQLVNARDVKHAPGRPKTDRLDAVWLAKLTEKGLVRPSFVPPQEIRALRDYTRMRIDLIHERTRYWQRLEKLLEDALIKISSVSSTLNTLSTRAMLQAMIAGERDPRLLAELAKGRLRVKIPALVEALNGRFDDHHGELAGLLLAQIDGLDAQVARLAARIETLLTQMPDVRPAEADPDPDPHPGEAASSAMDTVARLDEIPGISPEVAQIIIAEIGLDMTRFPTAEHLASWAKLSPQTVQSGTRSRGAAVGKGNPYLKGVLGTAAVWPAAPTPSSVNATGASPNGAAGYARWSPSAAPSWSSSGICCPTRTPATVTWEPTTSSPRLTGRRRPAPISASSRR